MKYLVFAFFFLTISTFTTAQKDTTITHIIQSEAFDKDRTIRVFLPKRYFEDSTARFTVTYMLDGHYDPIWNLVKGNIGYMMTNYNTIPMIVVAIHSDNRGREFTPPATQLTDHIKNEIFPLVEKNYRTLPFRTIIGHSWGGIYINNALFSGDTDLYDAYIAISPSMGYKDNMVLRQADSVLQHRAIFNKFLYCSTGDVGSREANFGSQVAILDSLIHHHQNPTLVWQTRQFEGTGHWSCVAPSLIDGLLQMSRTYWFDQQRMEAAIAQSDKPLRPQILDFNKKCLDTYGYVYESNANYLRFVADDLYELGHLNHAKELFEWSYELNPNNLRTLIGMGNVYRDLKDHKNVIKIYEEAIVVVENTKDTMSEELYNGYTSWFKETIEEHKALLEKK